MDPDGHENQDKYGHIPDHKEGFGGDEVGEEGAGDGVDLMAGADEDEGGEEDVDDGVVGDEDEHTMGVCAQPDMVLSDEQLQIQSAEPGKKTERKYKISKHFQILALPRISASDAAHHVAQESKGEDGEGGDVGVDLVAVQLVPGTTENKLNAL